MITTLVIALVILSFKLGYDFGKIRVPSGLEILDPEIDEDLKESLEEGWKKFSNDMDEFRRWKIEQGKFYCHERTKEGAEVCTEPCKFCKESKITKL